LLEDLFERITLYDNRLKNATYRELADGKYEITMRLSAQKLVVDDQQQETPVSMNDWIEIGAFAAPPAGSSYGDTLYRQRVRLTAGDHELKFVVDQIPHRVGVDPFYLLIDRMPEDNLQKPTADSTPPQ
jgi:ABC-2 type transport system permease protein